MRPGATQVAALLALGLLAPQIGCQSGAGGASILSLFGLSEKPLVVALVVEPGVLDPFSPYEKLREAMSTSIKRPVRLDLCLPVQLEPNLTLGFYDLAMVTPACYFDVARRERFEVLALPADETGHTERRAVLVVAAESPIKAVAELRGKRVAFGPRGDIRTHHAGLALLRDNGVGKSDLSLALLPIPGSLRHFATMDEIARSVIGGDSDAGFIDEDALAGFDEAEIRDKLRVIGQTVALPEKLLIRSPKASAAIVRKVVDFLLGARNSHPDALRPLAVVAYEEPTAEFRESWAHLVKSLQQDAASAAPSETE